MSGQRWDVLVVKEGKNEGDKPWFTKVGVAFETKSQNGNINIYLDALPLDGKLLLSLPKEQDRQQGERGQFRGDRGGGGQPRQQQGRSGEGGGGQQKRYPPRQNTAPQRVAPEEYVPSGGSSMQDPGPYDPQGEDDLPFIRDAGGIRGGRP